MMMGGDVPKIACAEAEHHRSHFVDSVPAETGLKPADRCKARAGVELGGTASVKRRGRHFVPARAARLVERGTGDPEARVLFQFRQQQFRELRLESQIGVKA